MHVVHVTPTFFDEQSVIGGGERYPSELATWMARRTPTTLVSFSRRRQSARRGDLRLEIYPVRHLLQGNKCNPLSFRFLAETLRADVVHTHGIYTLVSDLACLAGAARGKPVFVTEYGGGGARVLSNRLPVLPRYRAAVAYSQFGLEDLTPVLRAKARLIKGGIDTERFCPDPAVPKQKHILFVGRILPHKGVNDLVAAFRLFDQPGYRLRIVGRVYHERFYADLQEMARGLAVDFIHDADDARIIQEYRTAQATVLPSVHRDLYGNHSGVPELMGFTLLESQACGTPAVCTDAGAMSEFVQAGVTGAVAAQNSPESLCAALRQFAGRDGDLALRAACVDFARRLNWESVVAQHLQLYRTDTPHNLYREQGTPANPSPHVQ